MYPLNRIWTITRYHTASAKDLIMRDAKEIRRRKNITFQSTSIVKYKKTQR